MDGEEMRVRMKKGKKKTCDIFMAYFSHLLLKAHTQGLYYLLPRMPIAHMHPVSI